MKLILLAKSSIQTTEIIFYASMIFSILILLMLLIPIAFGDKKKQESKKTTFKPKEKGVKKTEQEKDIIEIFDYC